MGARHSQPSLFEWIVDLSGCYLPLDGHRTLSDSGDGPLYLYSQREEGNSIGAYPLTPKNGP